MLAPGIGRHGDGVDDETPSGPVHGDQPATEPYNILVLGVFGQVDFGELYVGAAPGLYRAIGPLDRQAPNKDVDVVLEGLLANFEQGS